MPNSNSKFLQEQQKILPHDLSAERGILGSILMHGKDLLIENLEGLESSYFYDHRHKIIFDVILTLNTENKPIDEITITYALKKKNQLDLIGGPLFLAKLSDVPISSLSHINYYVFLVRNKALLRKFIITVKSSINQAYLQQNNPVSTLKKIEKTIFDSTRESYKNKHYVQMESIIDSSLKMIKTQSKTKNSLTGIPTEFKQLDSLTAGLQPSDLIIIAGRPSTGKTAFALNIAANIALKNKIPVAIFSLEMSKEQLGVRLLSSESKITGFKIRSGNLDNSKDWEKLNIAARKLHPAPIFIDDTPSIDIIELKAKAKRIQINKGLGLILIDYLQLMHTKNKKFGSREQEISEISRSLKALAKELNIPVIALSQLNRKVEERPDKRPILSDLRESGAIEQDADIIAFIYHQERKNTPPSPHNQQRDEPIISEIIIGKQRNGPIGTVKLKFFNKYTRFEDFYD